MIFKNKSKYNSIIFKSNNQKESELFQKLVFKYGFNWRYNHTELINTSMNDSVSYIYVIFDGDYIVFSNSVDNNFIFSHNLNFHKFYTIDDYNDVLNFLKHGINKPLYNSKKILKF